MRQRSYSFNRLSWRERVVRYALLLVVLVITMGPFLWELSTSLKGASEDIWTTTPQLIPAHPTLRNYRQVAAAVPVLHYIQNSLVVAVIVVVGNTVGAAAAGFALARMTFRFRRLVLGLFLATLVLPGEATIISQYVIVRELGLVNTLVGVALPGFIGAFNVLLAYNAFRAIPEEIDLAALIDGANAWQRFRHIGLPSITGTLAVIAIFSFIGAWDDFLWPLIVLNDNNNLTLTVGLNYLNGAFGADQRMIAAGTMIAFIPIAIVFGVLQRYFFRGVGEAGVKG